jgi:hypothetical protein
MADRSFCKLASQYKCREWVDTTAKKTINELNHPVTRTKTPTTVALPFERVKMSFVTVGATSRPH